MLISNVLIACTLVKETSLTLPVYNSTLKHMNLQGFVIISYTHHVRTDPVWFNLAFSRGNLLIWSRRTTS